jgi:hypothetical protein
MPIAVSDEAYESNEAPTVPLKPRHYLAIASFLLLVASLAIIALGGGWTFGAMVASLALLLFFLFALLIPSSVYKLNP